MPSKKASFAVAGKVALTFPGVERQHCVSEATSGMRHGHCAIAHGIQLVQPTRLKARGHEQKITGCSDLVAHGHIEANPASCSIWICTFQPSHACLQVDLQLFRASLGLNTFMRPLSKQSQYQSESLELTAEASVPAHCDTNTGYALKPVVTVDTTG